MERLMERTLLDNEARTRALIGSMEQHDEPEPLTFLTALTNLLSGYGLGTVDDAQSLCNFFDAMRRSHWRHGMIPEPVGPSASALPR